MRITAAVATGSGEALTIHDLELDDPRPDEVRVRMVATGVCHTDAIVRDQVYPTPLPAVLGHEGAGVVEEIGVGVAGVSVGDHVVLSFDSCGRCRNCLRGRPAYCVELFARNFGGRRPDGSSSLRLGDTEISSRFFGQSSFGSFANVAERSVVPVPKDVPLDLLGPLGCGIQTGAGAVMNSLRPAAGSTMAVFGAGAVGSAALLAAVVTGCSTIIAVDVVDSRLELALTLGATHTVNGRTDDPVEAIREITGGGVDFAIESTAVPAVLSQAAESLGYGGTVGLVGAQAPETNTTLETGSSLLKGWGLRTIIEGDAVPQVFIPQLIDLWRQGRFPFDTLVTRYPIAQITQAFDDSADGTTVKPVVVFA